MRSLIVLIVVPVMALCACGSDGDDAESSAAGPGTTPSSGAPSNDEAEAEVTTEPTEASVKANEAATECMQPDAVAAHFGYLGLQLTAKPPEELEPLELYECEYDGPSGEFASITLQAAEYPDSDIAETAWAAVVNEWNNTAEGIERLDPTDNPVVAQSAGTTPEGTNVISFARSGDVICTVFLLGSIPDGSTPELVKEYTAALAAQVCGLN